MAEQHSTKDDVSEEQAALTSLVGQTIAEGRYSIDALLGFGRLGGVFKAVDHTNGLHVAFKCLLPKDWGIREREDILVYEGTLARQMGEHPNLPWFVDMGRAPEWSHSPFVAYQLLDGISLWEALRGDVSLESAVRWGLQVGRGLAWVHGHNVVHCDVTPRNCLIEEVCIETSQVWLFDFSHAVWLEDGPLRVASNDDVKGMRRYMSPEQRRGERPEKPMDVYSFGMVLYDLLTDQSPFVEPSSEEHGDHECVASAFSNMPVALSELVNRCLAGDPSKRPEMPYVVQSLQAILARIPLAEEATGSLTTKTNRVVPKQVVRKVEGNDPVKAVKGEMFAARHGESETTKISAVPRPVTGRIALVTREETQPKSTSPSEVERAELSLSASEVEMTSPGSLPLSERMARLSPTIETLENFTPPQPMRDAVAPRRHSSARSNTLSSLFSTESKTQPTESKEATDAGNEKPFQPQIKTEPVNVGGPFKGEVKTDPMNVGGPFKGEVKTDPMNVGGLFKGEVKTEPVNVGGPFKGEVKTDPVNVGGPFKGEVKTEPTSEGGLFKGEVKTEPTSEGGPFKGEVEAESASEGGLFKGEVKTDPMNVGGPFKGEVKTEPTSEGGPFKGEVKTEPVNVGGPFKGEVKTEPVNVEGPFKGEVEVEPVNVGDPFKGEVKTEPASEGGPFKGEVKTEPASEGGPFKGEVKTAPAGVGSFATDLKTPPTPKPFAARTQTASMPRSEPSSTITTQGSKPLAEAELRPHSSETSDSPVFVENELRQPAAAWAMNKPKKVALTNPYGAAYRVNEVPETQGGSRERRQQGLTNPYGRVFRPIDVQPDNMTGGSANPSDVPVPPTFWTPQVGETQPPKPKTERFELASETPVPAETPRNPFDAAADAFDASTTFRSESGPELTNETPSSVWNPPVPTPPADADTAVLPEDDILFGAPTKGNESTETLASIERRAEAGQFDSDMREPAESPSASMSAGPDATDPAQMFVSSARTGEILIAAPAISDDPAEMFSAGFGPSKKPEPQAIHDDETESKIVMSPEALSTDDLPPIRPRLVEDDDDDFDMEFGLQRRGWMAAGILGAMIGVALVVLWLMMAPGPKTARSLTGPMVIDVSTLPLLPEIMMNGHAAQSHDRLNRESDDRRETRTNNRSDVSRQIDGR